MSDIYRKDKRDWLNPASRADSGSVMSHVSIEVYADDKPGHHSELHIRDCSRSVSLNFSCDSRVASINRRRRKIEILRKHLNVIEEGLNKFEEVL